jgi:hypothetical protein
VYPDERVARLIEENFLPVRVHVREQKEEFKRLGERYGVQWTPAILLLDPTGKERHRIEGFLPADDFLAQLMLGLGHVAFGSGRFDEAEREFNKLVETRPDSDAAAEALYWAGVSRYKATNDATALRDTARQFRERYLDSSWAKKASVWGA